MAVFHCTYIEQVFPKSRPRPVRVVFVNQHERWELEVPQEIGDRLLAYVHAQGGMSKPLVRADLIKILAKEGEP
jgi:hypothetical protein